MRFLRIALMVILMASAVHAQIGLNWTQAYPSVHEGYAIVLSPLSDQVLYLHDNVQKAFMVSYDAGATWSQRGTIDPQFGIRTIRVSPLDTSIIVMVGNTGVLRSTDGGYNWVNVQPNGSIDGESIDYNKAHPDTMYFVDFYSSEFWLSADTGRTWQVRSVVPYGHVCTVAADPFHPNVIVVGAGDTKIARSTDYGATWSLVKGGNPYFSECPKIVWDKRTPNYVYAAIQQDLNYSFFRSTDGGATWTDMGLYGIFMWGLDQDSTSGDLFIGAFGFTNSSGQTSYDQGVYRSADQGKSWQQLGNTFTYPNVWMIKAANETHDVYVLNADAAGAFGNVNLYKLNTNPSAYGKVSGTITATGGTIIQHASVVVVGGGDSCIVNNSEGTYTMYLSPGTYTLRAQTGGVQTTIENVTVMADAVTMQNFQLSIDQTVGSINVSHSNIYQDEVDATVQLWGHYSNGSPLLIEATTTSNHTFTDLSSLNTYDSIVVFPNTLPYISNAVSPISLGGSYSINIDRADIFIINDPDINNGASSGGNYAPYYQKLLVDSGFTSVSWNVDVKGRSLPLDAIEKTKRKSVFWLNRRHGFTSFPSNFLDTLALLCDRGFNFFIGGQNLVENDSDHTFFKNKLGAGFASNYTSTSTIRGFTGNMIGDGIITSLSLSSSNSRDVLKLLSGNAHKAFYYGTSTDTLNIGGMYNTNTGGGGAAVYLPFEVFSMSTSILGTIFKRSLDAFAVVPAPPTGLNATVQNIANKEIQLMWTASSSPNIISYLIYRDTVSISDTTSKRIASLGDVNSYVDVVVDYGNYYYKIFAVNNSGVTSSASNEASVVISPEAPAAPSGLNAMAISASKIQLSWTDNSNNETGFVVARSLSSGSGFVNIDTVGMDVVSTVDSNLAAGTAYYYRVTAINANGSSAASNEASATTYSVILYPPKITTSILQNPALPKYFDLVIVSDTVLSKAPVVKKWIDGSTDTSGVTMNAIPGVGKVYRGSSVFAGSGTYKFLITATALNGRDSVQIRDFGVLLAKPGLTASLTTPGGRATLRVNKRSVDSETYLIASEETESVKFGPETGYGEELVLTMHYDESVFPDESKLFISQKTSTGWTTLRTQVYADGNQVRALVKQLGEFKVVYDPSFTGSNVVPKEFALKQNYPNPFNPSTTIAFDLPQDGNLKLAIYNLLGQKVKTLYSGFQLAGSYTVQWNGKNELGQQVASGIYLYRIETGAFVKTKKMMLIK